MKLDFISQTSSKFTLPFAGLQQLQQCQVNPNEWCMKNGLLSVGLNPPPLSHESSALTTRPRLLSFVWIICIIHASNNKKIQKEELTFSSNSFLATEKNLLSLKLFFLLSYYMTSIKGCTAYKVCVFVSAVDRCLMWSLWARGKLITLTAWWHYQW